MSDDALVMPGKGIVIPDDYWEWSDELRQAWALAVVRYMEGVGANAVTVTDELPPSSGDPS